MFKMALMHVVVRTKTIMGVLVVLVLQRMALGADMIPSHALSVLNPVIVPVASIVMVTIILVRIFLLALKLKMVLDMNLRTMAKISGMTVLIAAGTVATVIVRRPKVMMALALAVVMSAVLIPLI
ncbi:MAG: hypothetical protein ACLFO2_02615 [Candidatus Woesearchaeota archaeon]